MKLRIILISLCFCFATSIGFAQSRGAERSIISDKVSIKKYHTKDELDRMQKGQLLNLYIERIETLVNLLPYIAFATKPGVTFSTLGIPNDSNNTKALESQFEATDSYLSTNNAFQRRLLPYSDTRNLVAAILFYEETMKSLHQYSEFN